MHENLFRVIICPRKPHKDYDWM